MNNEEFERKAAFIVEQQDEFAEEKPDWDVEGSQGEPYVVGSYHVPRWLAVSLDLFGFTPVGIKQIV